MFENCFQKKYRFVVGRVACRRQLVKITDVLESKPLMSLHNMRGFSLCQQIELGGDRCLTASGQGGTEQGPGSLEIGFSGVLGHVQDTPNLYETQFFGVAQKDN